MSEFKDQLQADLAVFLNIDEFGDIHNLDGVECEAVIESPTMQEAFIASNTGYEGYFGTSLVMYCRTADLVEIPVAERSFSVDGKDYIVANVSDDKGLLCIELRAETREYYA